MRKLIATVVGFAAATVAVAAPATAASDPAAESRFVALTNDTRAEHGLAPLAVRGELQSVARRHAVRMADEDRVFHNRGLPHEVDGWQRLGENVGKGPTVEEIHAAFMASASHRRNILDGGFTEVGIGVEVRGGVIWVAEVFREPVATADGPRPSDSDPSDPTPSPSSTPDPDGPPEDGSTTEEPSPSPSPTGGGALPPPLSASAPAGGTAGDAGTAVGSVGTDGEAVRPPPADRVLSALAPRTGAPTQVVASAITVTIRPCLRSVIPAGCVLPPSRSSMLELASVLVRRQPRPLRF